jgi:hypothetical protein
MLITTNKKISLKMVQMWLYRDSLKFKNKIYVAIVLVNIHSEFTAKKSRI